MNKRKRWFVIAYDVSSPKRLQRLYKLLRKKAYALHQSVFLYKGTKKEIVELQSELKKIIKVTSDDVRIYWVSSLEMFITLGKEMTDNDVIISELPQFKSWSS